MAETAIHVWMRSDGFLYLHEAVLDDSRWPAFSTLIDAACGIKGNMLIAGEGHSRNDMRIFLTYFCFEGQRCRDLEFDYFNTYYQHDERVPRLVLHALPVGKRHGELSTPHVAVLVLIVDPEAKAQIDPVLVKAALGITPAESQVAVRLATGESVREIALNTGRKEGTIRGHVKHIQHKTGISRQMELIRRVLSLAGLRN